MAFEFNSLEATLAVEGLLASRDDYSLKIAHRADPRFWLRVETDPGSEVVVSDLTLSEQTTRCAAIALAFAVESLGARSRRPLSIVFRDIRPDASDVTEIRASEIRRVLNDFAAGTSRFVRDVSLVQNGRKTELHCDLD